MKGESKDPFNFNWSFCTSMRSDINLSSNTAVSSDADLLNLGVNLGVRGVLGFS